MPFGRIEISKSSSLDEHNLVNCYQTQSWKKYFSFWDPEIKSKKFLAIFTYANPISHILQSYAFRNISFNVKKEQFFNVRVTMDWI